MRSITSPRYAQNGSNHAHNGSNPRLAASAILILPSPFIGQGSYEREVVRQCFRFLSSETEYAARDQHLLLRCLRNSAPKERADFFAEVRDLAISPQSMTTL